MEILVTPRSLTSDPHHPALERLRAAGHRLRFCRPGTIPDETELRVLLPGCTGWLAGVEPISAATLDHAPQLRVISRNGTGLDNIDLAAARARKITVRHTPGANAGGVAELTITLLLLLARRPGPPSAALAQGRWERGPAGRELAGRHLGLIGLGRVGRLVAGLALAFGMRVSAHDPALNGTNPPDPRIGLVAMDELLAAIDALSLHCPHRRGAPPLIDAAALAELRPGAWLINTARAALVDDTAVAHALEAGRLDGYAVDVFDPEPPPPSPLLRRPDVIASPHLGGYTVESIDRAAHMAVDHLLATIGS